MKIHLLDGTYELFRHHFGAARGAAEAAAAGNAQPALLGADGEPAEEVAATRGVMWSVVNLLESGVTHLGVATDHVVESFRNELWPGYKTSAGMPPELLAQFPLLEESLEALGVVVWPMVELEADDALAAGAAIAARDPAVDQVVIMTPDKDLSQCVVGERVVQLDRRTGTTLDEAGVVARYGISPASIPDWLALVGDSADGFPGLKGWGKKAASTVLARYRHLEDIPANHFRWELSVRGAAGLAATLAEQHDMAFLFRDLATLRSGAEVVDGVGGLLWTGPTRRLPDVASRLRAPGLTDRVAALSR